MLNTAGRKWEVRYIPQIQSQEQGKLRGSMEPPRELNPIIGHKVSSTIGPKERDVAETTSKKINRLEAARYSIIVMEEIVIVTWDMR